MLPGTEVGYFKVRMDSRFKYLRLATVAFFLVAAIAYACPGNALVSKGSSGVAKAMPSHDMGGNEGCGETNVNQCQWARDQILSGTVSLSKADVELHRLCEHPQNALAAAAPVQVFSGASPPATAAFHPVFKLPLSFSYLVLRL
jgi:hypothetical protein